MIYLFQKANILKLIKEYVLQWKHTLTANDVAIHVKYALNTSYSIQVARNLMKKELNLSFKRVKSRPNSISMPRINLVRRVFSIRFSQLVSTDSLLINIDESSINRGSRPNYSWYLKGLPIETCNSTFTGSVSMILSICSNRVKDQHGVEWYNWLNYFYLVFENHV